MRSGVLIVFFISFSLLAEAQERNGYVAASDTFEQYLGLYLSTDNSKTVSTSSIESFVEKLESKKSTFKKDYEFLQYTFNQTHRKFLKHYKQYCTFTELVDKGNYNCLTATALYALLLQHLDIEYTIVETNYHIFLLAQTEQGTVLLETTDPFNGFISKTSEIEKRISAYKQNELKEVEKNKTVYAYNFNLYHAVDLDQMLGLLYYNLAIEAYNNQKIQLAISYLDQATVRYQSARIEEFSSIILLTLQESKMESSIKNSYLQKVKAIQTKKLSGLANGY
jgi:hypothetical protein